MPKNGTVEKLRISVLCNTRKMYGGNGWKFYSWMPQAGLWGHLVQKIHELWWNISFAVNVNC